MHFSYKLFENSTGSLNISTIEPRSITFRSPCYNNRQCTPYVITLSPAVYRIEAWGSAGSTLSNVKPGKGAYAKGIIVIRKRRKFFAYIGTKVGFNSQQTPGGGATDLRLYADNWYEFESLKSRILVAGGGGGTEWKCSAGGNAGLNGTTGYGCSTYTIDSYDTSYYCTGATQTGGGECPSTLVYGGASKPTFKGTFGSSGDNVISSDLGGMGGGGYYGGGSSSHAGAGGGDLPLFQAIQDAKPFPKTPQAKVQYSTYQVVCITPDFSFMKLKSFLEVHRCHTTSLSPLSPETQMMAR